MADEKGRILSYRLQFFAKDGPGGEKTEPATEKKKTDARKEGQVAKSKDLGNAVSLIALFLSLKIFVLDMGKTMLDNFQGVYSKIVDFTVRGNERFSVEQMHGLIVQMMIEMILILLPIFSIGVIVSFLSDVFQVKWKVTTKPLQPKLNKINPVSGFKKIFSMRSIVELLKSIAVIIVIGVMAYSELKKYFPLLYSLYNVRVIDAIAFVGTLVIELGLKISLVFLVIGFADLLYQKHKHKEDLKMTKQEVKDEYKNSEGDPQIKGQIKKKMMQASQRRMMQSVPQADVVITNPTHFAVAIQYSPMAGAAPVVVAKGEDYLAQRIKEKAKEHNVEIVENKPLARALYYNVEIGSEIPSELYQAVAEVLAFVYKVKNKVYSPTG